MPAILTLTFCLVDCPFAIDAAAVPPVLPAEVAWNRVLDHAAATTAVADGSRIYVPLRNGEIVALSRDTGEDIWTTGIRTGWPVVVADESLFVMSGSTLIELDPGSGNVRRRHTLPGAATGPLTRAGELLLIPVEPSLLIAWHAADAREIWRQQFDTPVTVAPAVSASWGAVIVASGDRVSSVALSDGARRWTAILAGTLMQPVIVRDRVIVGSTSDDVYALDDRGRGQWTWPGWADVVGVTADAGQIYVASLDNIVRALKPDGNLQWRKRVPTRLTFAPQLVGSTLLIGGIDPALTALSTSGGDAGKYELPELSSLAVAPLVLDAPEPDDVTMVLFTRAREVFGLRRQRPKEEPEETKEAPQKSSRTTGDRPSGV